MVLSTPVRKNSNEDKIQQFVDGLSYISKLL